MSKIIDTLSSKEELLAGKGATEDEIVSAEEQLGLRFNSEYREYLKTYKIAAYDGHELTGISKSSRLNVASVTIEEWQRNEKIPHSMYVIENTGMEDVIIWQDADGRIYYAQSWATPTLYHESLSEYILIE